MSPIRLSTYPLDRSFHVSGRESMQAPQRLRGGRWCTTGFDYTEAVKYLVTHGAHHFGLSRCRLSRKIAILTKRSHHRE